MIRIRTRTAIAMTIMPVVWSIPSIVYDVVFVVVVDDEDDVEGAVPVPSV